MFEVIHGQNVPISHLPFSPAVRAGEFVFVSGQASVDDTGQIVPDTLEGEVRRTFANVQRILAAAGLDLSHVVQVRSYVRDSADVPAYNAVYREFFSAPFPARTTLTGCLPDTIRFEADVVAWKKK